MIYSGSKQISKRLYLIFKNHYGSDAEIELENYTNLAFKDVDYTHWPADNDQEAFDLLYEAILDAFEAESYSDNEVGIIAAEVYIKHLGYIITDDKELIVPGKQTIDFLESYDYKVSNFPY